MKALSAIAISLALVGTSVAAGLDPVPSPAGPESAQPWLFATPGGRVLLSWVEPAGEERHALRFSSLDGERWSEPRTVAEGVNWFVNWADVPSVVADDDGWMAAHWLVKNGEDTYAYDVHVAQSRDGGRTWGAPAVLNDDGTETEHGFVSMLPRDSETVVTWLDGRKNASVKAASGGHGDEHGGEMTLRAARLLRDGRVLDATELDGRTCDCCPTAIAPAPGGALVAYRDRSANETRAIALVRYGADGGGRARGGAVQVLFDDAWVIEGCPVNGPALDVAGDAVALAWFTMAHNRPEVWVSLRGADGTEERRRTRADDGAPIGRVDVVALDDGGAVVCWLEQVEGGAEVRLRRVGADGRAGASMTAAQTSAARASGHPRIVRRGGELVAAWTEVGEEGTVVRTARGPIDAIAKGER